MENILYHAGSRARHSLKHHKCGLVLHNRVHQPSSYLRYAIDTPYKDSKLSYHDSKNRLFEFWVRMPKFWLGNWDPISGGLGG
jgi:hypothetical protein